MDYEIKNDVGIFQNVLTNEQCQQFIDYYKVSDTNNKAFTRQTMENIATLYKNDTTVLLPNIDQIKCRNFPFDMTKINESIAYCYNLYVKKYSILNTIKPHTLSSVYRLQKTDIGGGYHNWHCEVSSINFSSRIAAWSIYLNDVDEGGETEFLYYPMRIAAKAGTLCIFPSGYTHTHRGNPPISNEKYILTSWIDLIE